MELILHATPGGDFGDKLNQYWSDIIREGRETEAQQWLPHATVATSLRCSVDVKADLRDEDVVVVSSLLQDIVDLIPSSNRKAPRLQPLRANARWCFIEFECPQWISIGKKYKDAVWSELSLECKVELNQHISIARGTNYQYQYHLAQANQLLNGLNTSTTPWNLGLWSQIQGEWKPQLLIPW